MSRICPQDGSVCWDEHCDVAYCATVAEVRESQREQLCAEAWWFSLRKNEVVTLAYTGAPADEIERTLCDICNEFLDRIAPGWRNAGPTA